MKKILSFICSAVLAVSLTGCSDFLNLSPISQANEGNYYKTADDFESAMVSVYSTLYTIYGPQCLPSYYGELFSDNAWCNETAGDYTDKIQLSTHQGLTSANAIALEFWNSYYACMFKVNNVISKAQDADFSEAKAYEAEGRFLRALYYFDMVRAWGDVPLVLKPVTASEAYAMARTPASEVYAAIVEDLTYAAANLPDKSGERFKGAATSDAANTLLGKVYLTMGDKGSAATALKKVYGKFQLESDYANLWSLSNKNCKESIFEVQYLGGANNPYSRYWAIFSPLDNRSVTAWGMGANQVTDDLYDAYEAGDPRRDASIQNGYVSASGEQIEAKFTIKWRDDNAELSGLTEAADNNFIILRYADVLLMLTEATGDASYMNAVRARAGLGAVSYSVDNLLHEYQVEFGCEFHRMFDLLRLGDAVSVLNNSSKHTSIKNRDELYLPIPQYVIDQNPDVMEQNAAYK